MPLFIRAPVTGFLVLMIGSVLTALPLAGNLAFLPEIPWALPATLLVLWGYWTYFAGGGWPVATQRARRVVTRETRLPGAVWGAALFPSLAALVLMISFRLLLPSLLPMAPPEISTDLNPYPLWTVWGLLLSVAVSAGVTEETAFRGYMQQPLETAYGLPWAILLVGFCFWLAHLSHATLTWTHLPFHLLASAVLGVLVYLTRSLLPAIVLHTVADIVLQPTYFFRWPDAAWQALATRPVWESGTNEMLPVVLGVVAVSGVLTVWSFRRLARTAAAGQGPARGFL